MSSPAIVLKVGLEITFTDAVFRIVRVRQHDVKVRVTTPDGGQRTMKLPRKGFVETLDQLRREAVSDG